MKSLFTLAFVLFIQNTHASISKSIVDSIVGDFNGDGKVEYAWINTPVLDNSGIECLNKCVAEISFSDSSIPSFYIDNCIYGKLDNLSDLNNNKTQELGILSSWFTGCSDTYYTYTLVGKHWELVIKPFSISCNFSSDIKTFVKKDNRRKGHLVITFTDTDNAGNVTIKSKSTPIKYYKTK